MTAIGELCALLDARGVEWDRGLGSIVEWVGANERLCRAYARPEPLTVDVAMLSVPPAQAVEATLGRRMCRMEQIEEACYDDIECSECGVCLWGFQMDKQGEGVFSKPKFCPYCGREVVE